MFNLTLREIEIFIRIFEKILGDKNKIAKWVYQDCYSFFICLFLKEKKVFNQILNGNFTVEKFVSFVKNREILFNLDLDEDGTITSEDMKDITYKNNHILGMVACSFMKDKKSEVDKDLILTTFQSLNDGNIRNIFSRFGEGFDSKYFHSQIQPAVDICKNIEQCKSIF